MAEAILFNVTADIIFKLGSSLLREFGSLWRVKDDLDKLEDTLSAIQSVLHDAEEQQSKNSQVNDWVLKLKDVLYEIDDLIDKSSYETLRRQVLAKDRRKRKQVCTLFSKFKFSWKICHRFKEIRQRLQAINDDKNQFSFCKHVIEKREDEGLRKRRETHSFILEEEVIGRSNDNEAVIDLLLNSNTKENIAVVSIIGMGGLGKTTLAQSIYTHHNMTKNGFQLKLWVCVSEEFDLKVIIQKIIESATGKKPESFLQIDSLQSELRKQIDGKKYLLVMDDVWNEKTEEWLHLKRLLMCGAKGSRILITTRSEQVAKTFDSTFVHSLRILNAPNSWLLFQKMTGLEGYSDNQEELDEKDSNLVQIGKEIVSRLNGVPLVIRTIGGLLKNNKSERFWLSFKDKELYQILEQGYNDLKEIKFILELSYKYLPTNLKQCFLYCALFPKDHEIQKDELILL
ncbi:putative disease resistance protein RGA3 [Benincasa hispida]|uniref:putative disease resistance protein RGA3 n=1 Tax=Benincasa hispida TaxID=102211 RepID=UPI0019024791|nr:putative disease resistance protein RGA3 [Benincasa hispida]XP_038898680.1 putative disease resistance protein RGA3 [Benincasa hispida]XP_038898681.1 putative disease resistance protein RGA3 [Benincasa hispida]XP_038898683.1 putative disease resistance protein RGA3 [Benincasa hispida]